MKPKPTKLRPKVRAQIIEMFKSYKPGDMLSSFAVVRRVRSHVGKYVNDASIHKYLRGLREDGLINYTYVGSKADGVIKIIPIGEPHSV